MDLGARGIELGAHPGDPVVFDEDVDGFTVGTVVGHRDDLCASQDEPARPLTAFDRHVGRSDYARGSLPGDRGARFVQQARSDVRLLMDVARRGVERGVRFEAYGDPFLDSCALFDHRANVL
jgi:hypothetical protein